MSRLTRDGTAEPVSLERDQILRRERGQVNINFPVQLTTSKIGDLTRLIITLAVCDDRATSHNCPSAAWRHDDDAPAAHVNHSLRNDSNINI